MLEYPDDPHDAVVSTGLVGGGLVGGIVTAVGGVLAVVGLVVVTLLVVLR